MRKRSRSLREIATNVGRGQRYTGINFEKIVDKPPRSGRTVFQPFVLKKKKLYKNVAKELAMVVDGRSVHELMDTMWKIMESPVTIMNDQ